MKKLKIIGLILFISVLSCKQGKVLDLLKSLKHYSYSSYKPLSGKHTKIESDLLGAYEYNSLPVIISKRDQYTYNVKFLAMDSAKNNQTTVAHLTYLGNYRFLNIKIGDAYTFLRVKVDLEKDLNIYAVKSTLKSYIKNDKIKAFLTENGDEQYGKVPYQPHSSDSIKTKIYNHFLFNRITVSQAYALQREKIYGSYAKKYADCSDYDCYNDLYKENPYDTLLQISVLNIYERSNTLSELYFFTKKFPNNELTPIAFEKIKELEHYNKELKRFKSVKQEHTIPSYQEFKSSCDIFFFTRFCRLKNP